MSEIDRVAKALCEDKLWLGAFEQETPGNQDAWRGQAQAAINAVDSFRDEQRRKNCTHPRKFGGGAVGESGSYSYWHCQDCGASYDSRKPNSPADRKTEV
jgi:hypothetical protein